MHAMVILRRRKWLFIIPFTVVFLLPGVWAYHSMRSYKADSTVWLDSNVGSSSVVQQQATSQTGTPVQQEVLQLLRTRSFLTEVINNTSLDTPSGRWAAIAFLQKNLVAEVDGPNLLRFTFLGRTPREAVEIAGKTATEVVSWVKRAGSQQGEQSTAFFTTQSEEYRAELDKASAALQAYTKAHPETRHLDTAPLAVQAEYERLRSQEDYAQQVYDTWLASLAETQASAAASEEPYINGVRIIDAPVQPTSRAKKPLLMFGLLAFVVAIAVGATAVGFAESRDRTLHNESEVEEALGLQVLAVLPKRLHSARGPAGLGLVEDPSVATAQAEGVCE